MTARRKQRARQAAAVAYARATFDRVEAFAAALARDLDRCAALERETMTILAELTTLAHSPLSTSLRGQSRQKPAMPRPHGRGYLFGTNVEGMKAYNAVIAGNAKDAIVPWPAGKPPVDATEFSTSYAWASGSVISTIRVKPETQKQRIRWSPHAHYGLGITDSVGKFLGHNGAIPGFQTLIGYEPAPVSRTLN